MSDPDFRLDRRRMVLTVAAAGLLPATACARTPSATTVAVYKTPTCACCDNWIAHLRQAGFVVQINVLPNLRSLRSSHGMPEALASCHSGLIDGYFVEGHVPAQDIRRLIAQRPDAVGLSVPAMPLGSPGMETPGNDREPFDTLLVLKSGQTRIFARHNQTA